MSLLSRLSPKLAVECDSTMQAIPAGALLWLIGAFALLLAPQWDRLPLWLVAACAVLAVVLSSASS